MPTHSLNDRETNQTVSCPSEGHDHSRYRRHDIFDEAVTETIARNIADILPLLDDDPAREGLFKTPVRVARSLQYLTQGYGMDPEAILKSALFEEDYSEMILVKEIEIFSLCEHHMLPFHGRAHVAYIPDGKIVGLSKIPRVVDVFARRLQVQERLTLQIRDVLSDVLKPLGVAVVIEAIHLCMMMRGAEKQNAVTTTSAMSGEFMKTPTRAEFMRLINKD